VDPVDPVDLVLPDYLDFLVVLVIPAPLVVPELLALQKSPVHLGYPEDLVLQPLQPGPGRPPEQI
tara:strand:+ start:65 stop:259 length:195 start_codon:yes stop_codon:yes gene_type:complete